MKTTQVHITAQSKFDTEIAKLKALNPQLILAFGDTAAFSSGGWVKKAQSHFSDATFMGCTTAGGISNEGMSDHSLILTAVHFDRPHLKTASAKITSMEQSHATGKDLGQKLMAKDLKSVFVLGRGLNINGSALLEGLRESLGKNVAITGGLAGDAARFKQTFTVLNNEITDNCVVALGMYGEDLHVSYGYAGGWETFGPVRRVTKSQANVLFEIDNQPALDIYKKYLGDKADSLPASGLLYPFALLKDNQDATGLIRTILDVNEKDKSMTFAGDMPVNALVRLMHTSNEGLVEGARHAAESSSHHKAGKGNDSLGILISCVGRKLVMGEDVEDEIDAVREVLGDSTLTGFYSYGEICPATDDKAAKLHNQTMTITYLYEAKKAA